jgi:uncharacterized protein (TIGR02246 family)
MRVISTARTGQKYTTNHRDIHHFGGPSQSSANHPAERLESRPRHHLRTFAPQFKHIAETANFHGASRMLNRPGMMMMRIVSTFLAAGTALSPGNAHRTLITEQLRTPHAIVAHGEQSTVGTRLAKTFADTWNRRDGRAYGNAYWPDAELVDPSGQVWSGREAIIQTHRDLWAGPAKATHMTAHVRRVRALSPSLFVVDIDTSATGFLPPPPGAPNGVVQTRLKHVVERRNGDWKIVSSQNTFVSQH